MEGSTPMTASFKTIGRFAVLIIFLLSLDVLIHLMERESKRAEGRTSGIPRKRVRRG